MDYNLKIFIVLVIISLLVDLIRIKFKIKSLEGKNLLLIGGKTLVIGLELITFNFGLSIFYCLNSNTNFCDISGLNIMLASIGTICMLIGVTGYIFVLFKKLD